ncbi:uncharacterized protein [Typha latifolia]|uniref:uncharacterized protein n=1 Tax=Typha latifolia TaxID=4733 RepID=UPI003C2EA9C8
MRRTKSRRGATPPPPPPTPEAVALSPALSPMPIRRQPVILKKPARRRWAEVAGGTAAECAAVCCCFPCAVVDLVVLAVVRLPAGLCRRAIRARNRRKAKAKAKATAVKKTTREMDEDVEEDGIRLNGAVVVAAAPSLPSPEDDAAKLEKEMWARFTGAGFWRSPSQREDER